MSSLMLAVLCLLLRIYVRVKYFPVVSALQNNLGTLRHVHRSEKREENEAKRTCNPCEMLLIT